MAHMARVNAGLFPATTTCGDYLFSGHTVMMTMCTNIVSHYTSPERVTRRRLMWLFTFIGLLSIIATKLHYTIDVGIGLILTFQVCVCVCCGAYVCIHACLSARVHGVCVVCVCLCAYVMEREACVRASIPSIRSSLHPFS